MKDYNKSLIYEDASLARQIEEYLKKKEVSEEEKAERRKAKELGIEYELDDEEIKKLQDNIEEERQMDRRIMSGEFEEEGDES